jgi:hypothetical protein
MGKKYSLADIEAMDKDMLTASDVGPVMGIDPYTITLRAREGSLPFNCDCYKTRVRIPREAFIDWMKHWSGRSAT